MKTMLCIDPASTTTEKSYYTAMVVGSINNNDFVYIKDLLMQKLTFNQYCNKVIELLKKHKDITHIYIEKNTFQGADLLKIKELIAQDNELKNKRFEWINEMQRKNKDEKIATIIDTVDNGQIIINEDCMDSKDAIKQILDFQGQKYSVHDDFVDIVAECVNRIKTIQTKTILKVGNINDLYY